MWNIDKVEKMNGKIAIITGGNSGLGLETAKFLDSKGVEVIITVRNLEKGIKVIEQFKLKNTKAMLLNLANFDSIKNFTKEFKMKYEKLDYLINNAGVMMTDELKTEDGHELQFGTNHLGHFLLTKELLSILEKTSESRIIVLSSLAHRWGKKKINFENINLTGEYDKINAYSQSKLSNLMFAMELNERLTGKNSNIKVIACHPGFSKTNLQRELNIVTKFFTNLLSQESELGVLPSLRAITDKNLKGGEYLGPNGIGERKGKKVLESKVLPIVYDKKTRKRLWELSEKLIGETFVI